LVHSTFMAITAYYMAAVEGNKAGTAEISEIIHYIRDIRDS
jgi:hypothetical protein